MQLLSIKKIILFCLALSTALLCLTGCDNEHPLLGSIGIIGGADGSTNIVLTNKVSESP